MWQAGLEPWWLSCFNSNVTVPFQCCRRVAPGWQCCKQGNALCLAQFCCCDNRRVGCLRWRHLWSYEECAAQLSDTGGHDGTPAVLHRKHKLKVAYVAHDMLLVPVPASKSSLMVCCRESLIICVGPKTLVLSPRYLQQSGHLASTGSPLHLLHQRVLESHVGLQLLSKHLGPGQFARSMHCTPHLTGPVM